MTPDEKQQRAAEAAQLLANPYLREAFDRIERDAVEAIISAPQWDEKGDRQRRLAAERVRVIRDVRAALQSLIAEGQQAARQRPGVA